MRQNFKDEDKRILRQFGFSVGLAIIGVLLSLLWYKADIPRAASAASKKRVFLKKIYLTIVYSEPLFIGTS